MMQKVSRQVRKRLAMQAAYKELRCSDFGESFPVSIRGAAGEVLARRPPLRELRKLARKMARDNFINGDSGKTPAATEGLEGLKEWLA